MGKNIREKGGREIKKGRKGEKEQGKRKEEKKGEK